MSWNSNKNLAFFVHFGETDSFLQNTTYIFFEFEMNTFLNKIRRCKVCTDHLPLGPGPVVQLSAFSKIIIIGQEALQKP